LAPITWIPDGTINVNGSMPFAHVTVEGVPFDAWNQLVVVKDSHGFQKFYRNGTLVHTDRDSMYAPKVCRSEIG